MGKVVGAAEFKKNCLRIMEEASRNGETILITKRGKPFMEMKRAMPKERQPLVGLMKSEGYRFDDPYGPVYDKPWNAELGIRGDED